MVKGKKGTGLVQSRYQSGIYLGLLCVTVLVLIGCGAGRETPPPAAAGSSALPHAMKGYELYSWQADKEWHFTLITGTNRLKRYEEIVSRENVVTDTDWVKLSVDGIENLRAVLNRLPAGETITWISDRWLERVDAPKGRIQLPGPELLEEIESYCRRLGIQLQVAD
jgi:hypothetical protein